MEKVQSPRVAKRRCRPASPLVVTCYELRRTDVICTALCPGATQTEFFEVAGQEMTAYQRMTVMKSAEVARMIADLARQ